MSTSLWDRRLPRISYQVPVAIQKLGDTRRLSATTVNLSAGGMFVDTDELLAIGSPLVVKLSLSQQSESVEVKGRVAWLRPIWQADEHRPRGMGIKFTDIDAGAVRALEGLVGTRVEDSHPVVLEVDGSPKRIQARAQLTGEGIFLRTPLPFLQLGSNVRFCFNDDDLRTNYRGRIAQVSLHTGDDSGVPRLQVEVELTAIGDKTPPPPVDAPQITWQKRPLAESGRGSTDSPRRVRAQGSSPPDVLADDLGVPPTALDYDEATELPPVPESRWVESGAVEEAINGSTERAHRGRNPVAVAAAVCAGAAVTLALALALGDRGESPAAAEQATGATFDSRAAHAVQDERGQGAQATFDSRAARAAQDERGQEPGEKPLVRAADGKTTVTFRYRGDASEMNDYVLADPPAVAVNLPNAQPLGELGSFWIRDRGVRLVWVRERLGGMHVRVFFQGPRRPYTVSADGGAVIITFEP